MGPRLRVGIRLFPILFTSLFVSSALATIPTPEFFGIYVVVDGVPIELPDALADGRGREQGTGLVGVRVGLTEVSAVEAKPDSYFLFYGPEHTLLAHRIVLFKLEFGVPIKIYRDFTRVETIRSNIWLGTERVPVRIGPVPGVDNLVRVVPSEPLREGAYAFSLPDFGEETFPGSELVILDFYVGNRPEARQSGEQPRRPSVKPSARATPTPAPTPIPLPDVAGTWEGTVTNPDKGGQDSLTLVLTRDESSASYRGSFTLAGKDCSVSFVPAGQVGRTLLFKGKESSKFKCMFMGKMDATPNDDGSLTWRIFTTSSSSPILEGILNRTPTRQ